MRNPLKRRWMLERYGTDGRVIVPEAPEPRFRRYWTHEGAVRAAIRYNTGAVTIRAPWRFRLVKRTR